VEQVPAGTAFVATGSTAGWVCTNGGAAGSECRFPVGSLNVGAEATALFVLRVAPPVPAGVDSITNTVRVEDNGTSGPDATPGDNQASESTPVAATPDLRVTQTPSAYTVLRGGTVVFTINVSNTGSQVATGVSLTDSVPLITRFSQASSTAGWSCADNSGPLTPCTFSIGTLAPGETRTVTYALRVDTNTLIGLRVINIVSVGDDGTNGADPTPLNNTAIASSSVTLF
jgi:uncharacterized repeat protein (TIGR01451 family)